VLAALAIGSTVVRAQGADDADARARFESAVQQLRQHAGRWAVETRFLNPDGSVAATVQGTYRFQWVIEDRVLSGVSEIPSLNATSALVFFVSESRAVIEMLSIGRDGNVWTMSGPTGSEERQTSDFALPQGGSRRLRFTRHPISADHFESRMHFSDDGGRTWVPGNHQIFRRAT